MIRSASRPDLPVLAALLMVWAPMAAGEPAATETPEQFEARMAPWRAARFGMFIHWGPVSLKGTEIGWSRGAQVPIEEYDNLYKRFDPVKFDADAWAAVAKAAGMKYVVLTTKHHDGFCLWDTKETAYNIMNAPFKRDVTRELAEACRKQGLAFGTYYSTCDWYHPDFPVTSPGGKTRREKHDLDRYTEYLKAQTAELVRNYGPLFTVWFDVPQRFDAVRGQGVIDHLRAIQPGIVINNRTGAKGDYDTPEQKIGGFKMDRPWESCMTICRQWAWKPNDQMKSLEQCVRTLLQTVGGDGNLLFNVGPTPEGEIEGRQVDRLKEMGAWVAKHSASIHGTRGGPFKPGPWGASTRADNRITLFVFQWPEDGRLVLPAIPAQITAAATITGTAITVEKTDTGCVVIAPPAAERDPIATAVVLTLDGPALPIPACAMGGAGRTADSLTTGRKAKASNVYQNQAGFDADKAVDGDDDSRWATNAGVKEAWLEVDLGAEQTVAKAIVDEGEWSRVKRFAIQVQEGDAWKDVVTGEGLGRKKTIVFPAPAKGRVFRLNILEATDGPTIHEFNLHR